MDTRMVIELPNITGAIGFVVIGALVILAVILVVGSYLSTPRR